MPPPSLLRLSSQSLTRKPALRLFGVVSSRTITRSFTMATEQYFIIVPDHPNAPRLEVRPQHFSKISAEDSSVSNTLMGGAYLTEQPQTLDATTWGFAGSAMALELPAGSGEEGVKQWLKEDPYSKGGVWDWEKARIIKFKAGLSNPKGLSAGK